MKATGIVRKVDELGRIVIPRELRRTMNLEEGTPLEIFTGDGGIFLKKYELSCIFCGNENDLGEFMGHAVCPDCINKLQGKTNLIKRL